MKEFPFFFLPFFLFVFGNDLHAQCLPDGITFTSQAQIDSFPMNFPGCTEIEGNVSIIGSDIINLNGLESLTTIGGSLEIWSCGALTDLTGLEGLVSIGGDLYINSNPALTNLSGLEGLSYIPGSLFIGCWYDGGDEGLQDFGNSSLKSLEGLNNLTSIGEDMCVAWNDSLTDLNGLNSLNNIDWNLHVWHNNSLINFSGMEGLEMIGENFLIQGNISLKDFEGLNNLTSVGGTLSISRLDLGGPGGPPQFEYNESLESLAGLENLQSALYLQISRNPILSICHTQPICNYLQNGGPATIENNAPGCNSPQEVEDACLTVSVDDLFPEEAIQLFPNPTTGIIQIRTPDNGQWKVGIRNTTGSLVLPVQPIQNGQIDLSALPDGLYFLELHNGRQTLTRRIIKQ